MFFFNQKSGPVQKLSMAAAKEALECDKSICLLDVRTPEEYRSGHIPGSINLPLDRVEDIEAVAPEKQEKLFVYCLSGGRSARACGALAAMGYTDLTDLGGITGWAGPLERKGSA